VSRAHLVVVEREPRETLGRLIGTRELALLLGVSEREALRVGSRCPGYRVGRQRRWDPNEVLAALREEPER
jgi:hypothetical protein